MPQEAMRKTWGDNMIKIAIDGPAGAGKSTIARAVAAKMGYIYIDTGALYRSVGLYTMNRGADLSDQKQIEAVLSGLNVDIGFKNGEQRVFVNGEDVSDDIRTPAVSKAASVVSAVPAVREFLFSLQRTLADSRDSVMDGRDIGTVVLPDADVKIFLTASAERRADRRYKELLEKGESVEYSTVLDDIKKRDYADSHRDIAPLKQADDAVLADTSDLTLDESIALIEKIITERIAR